MGYENSGRPPTPEMLLEWRRVFYECGKNRAETARRCHVHPETIRKYAAAGQWDTWYDEQLQEAAKSLGDRFRQAEAAGAQALCGYITRQLDALESARGQPFDIRGLDTAIRLMRLMQEKADQRIGTDMPADMLRALEARFHQLTGDSGDHDE